MYLLGKIKFPHDDDDTKVSVPRFFMALASLAFAVYMVPGLWGAPLKAVSAFAPPMQTQDFNLYKNEVHAKFNDFDAGMEYARQQGKPVMIDFTGYGCVNCRKMELAVWTDPTVSKLLNEDYVLITLYVDEKTKLPEPVKVMENGTERTLRTVGDKWSYLQRSKFGANAQPFYVLLDNEGMPLNKSYSYDEDIQKYVEFLQTGLKNYKNNQYDCTSRKRAYHRTHSAGGGPSHRLYRTGGCGSLRGQGYGSIGEVSGNDYRTSEC